MSKRLGQTPFREILPDSIASDQTVQTVADALDEPLDSVTKKIPDLLLLTRLARDSGQTGTASLLPPLERLAALSGGLAELPEDALDLLAWQLHVERYEKAVSLSAKRAMVFASVLLHRKRGTPWAVRYGLETTLQVPARISEWFEYGGKPYFFRVYLDVSGSWFDATSQENAVSVIMAHKNVRSWLDFLRTQTTRRLPVHLGSAALNKTITQAFTWRQKQTFGSLVNFSGSGLSEITRSYAALVNRVSGPGRLGFYPFSGLTQLTRTKTGALHVAG